MAWDWALPQRLRDYLQEQEQNQERWRKTSNFGLLLDKFTPSGLEGSQKHEWLEAATSIFTDAAKEAMEAQQQRWLNMVAHSKGKSFKLITASPLIVGLGAAHVLDTSITLDRNTGMPLIPGSALKGLARTVGLVAVAEKLTFANAVDPVKRLADLEAWIVNSDDLNNAAALDLLRADILGTPHVSIDPKAIQRAIDFRTVFGTTRDAGKIVFVDGIYAGDTLPTYYIDIMNPHFSKYYTGSDAPSDDQNPVPVSYLTVAKGQPFWFAIFPRMPSAAPPLKRARAWLIRGLKEFGVGAKTARGSGLFGEPAN
jgi:CRISPR-associated protein Cmr6